MLVYRSKLSRPDLTIKIDIINHVKYFRMWICSDKYIVITLLMYINYGAYIWDISPEVSGKVNLMLQ